ncbi:MAG: endonuclease [Desulfuromonadales bacterium GWD2_61_12]|nr:MAG: endonuclease [Desulfuromonadales bacterium GWC2_61_20]OGR35864.1 MAG: endonuclease [Desulfuromonadales bacterium GWD2_61_12]HBT82564.1 GIY-YIG nuclease family protein [Desulfuromonas sp.]
MTWSLYIIRCSDGSLYTGITTNVPRRWRQHAAGRGAKYLRGRAPLQLVYVEGGYTRSSATRREIAVKKLNREQKLALITAADD